MKRINVTLDDLVLKNADDFCEENTISRSSLISIALTEYINAQKMLPEVQKTVEKQVSDFLREFEQKIDSQKIKNAK